MGRAWWDRQPEASHFATAACRLRAGILIRATEMQAGPLRSFCIPHPPPSTRPAWAGRGRISRLAAVGRIPVGRPENCFGCSALFSQ